MPSKLGLSETEFLIMQLFWSEDRGYFLGDVIKHFKNKGHIWAPQTVKTFLNNLIKKGALAAQRQGHQYLYMASMSYGSYSSQWLRGAIKQNFTNDIDDFILALGEMKQDLSEKQKEQLKRIWCE